MRKCFLGIISTVLFLLIAGCSGSDNQSGAQQKQVYSGIAGNAFQVSNGTDNDEQPAVAYDRNSTKYLSVWTDYRNGNADIFGKLCDASTAGSDLNAAPPVCGVDFAIASGVGNQWQPKVAFDYDLASNKYLVVYADTSATYSQIFGQFVTNLGVPSGAAFAISTHLDVADPSQIEPEVIYNDFRNTFTVAWLGTSNYDTDDYPDVANSVTATFTPTWKAGDATTLIAGGVSPNLNAAANAIVSIKFSNGIPVTGYTVSPLAPDATNTSSSIILNSNSNAIGVSDNLTITYADATAALVINGTQNFPAAGGIVAGDGGAITPVVPQTSLALAYFFTTAQRAIPATNVFQVPRSSGNLDYSINTGSNLLGKANVYWTSFQKGTISWAAPSWQAGSPIFVNNVYSGANSGGGYLVTIKNGVTDYTNQFDISISGGFLSATMKTGSALIGSTLPLTVTYTPLKNLYGPVVGRGCGNSYGPIPYIPTDHAGTNLVKYVNVSSTGLVTIPADSSYSQLVATENTDSGSAIVQKWTVSADETRPRLAYNPLDGNPFLVWSGSQYEEVLTISYAQDSNNPGMCTYSALFSKNPTKAATPQKIIIRRFINNLATDMLLGTSALYPAISVDPTKYRMLVSWEEQNSATFATSGKDIQGQLIDLTNFVLYGSLINVSNATGDQTAPSAEFDTVNQRHLVVWEDARNQQANISNIDIYGQFVDPQGNLSGGNVPISVDPGNQLSPVLAFGDADFRQFLIIWKDAQIPGNADLWGQLLQFSTLPQLVVADGAGNPILNGALNFGSVDVGLFKDIPIKLRNDGNTTLTLSPVPSPDAPFSFVTPTPVTINPGTAYDMVIRFSPTAAGSYAGNSGNNFKMSLLSNGGNTVLYFSGSGVGINPLTITTSSLPDILPTVATDTTIATLTGSGGVAPYTWSVTLPAGLVGKLSFNTATGVLKQLAGVPAIASASYGIPFTVTDSNSPAVSATRTLTLNVGSIGITTTQLSTWTQNSPSAYNFTIQSTGTTGVKTWSVPAVGVGSLPLGLSLNTGTGTITGTPTVSGSYSVSITLSDSGTGSTVTKSIPININPTPSITTSSLASGVVSQVYNQTPVMAGGTLPVTWELSGSLPSGLTFNTGTGAITGTPTTNVTYTPTISVTDATGATSSKALSITINPALDIATPTTGVGSPQLGLVGAQYNFTFATNSGGIAPYTWGVTAGALPLGMGTINPNTGLISGTPTINGNYTFTITVQDVNGAQVSKTYSITVSSPLSITTNTLRAGNIGVAYNDTLIGAGGIAPYSWSLTTGSNLPPGLSLSLAGLISGTPTVTGTTQFSVLMTDGFGTTIEKQLQISVSNPLTITTNAINSFTVNPITSSTPQSFAMSATGGSGLPYTWSSTTLPDGLTLSETGILSGRPSTPGSVTAVFTVIDAGGNGATKQLLVSVAPPIQITTTQVKSWTQGVNGYSQQLSAVGGSPIGGVPGQYTWSWAGSFINSSITKDDLPPGLSINSATGVISGSPSAARTRAYEFDVNAMDSNGVITTNNYFLQINPVIQMQTTALSSGTEGVLYNAQLQMTGGTAPFTWSQTGPLPAGLSLDALSGLIAGVPAAGANGSYPITVRVTDATGAFVDRPLNLTIAATLNISTTTLSSVLNNTPYSQTLAATGGSVPYKWTVTSGSLPTGLSLNTDTGVISGTSTVAGKFDFVVQLADSGNRTDIKNLSIIIQAPLNVTSSDPLNPWTQSIAGFQQQLTAIGGSGNYTWAITPGSNGQLPPGFTLTPGGLIRDNVAGVGPSVAGSFTFSVTATDVDNAAIKGSKQLTQVINPSLSITTSGLGGGVINTLYTQPLTASGGTAPVIWSLSAGSLPSGLSLDTFNGTISGIPTGPNVITPFTITAKDFSGDTKSVPLSISIGVASPITISTSTISDMKANSSVSFALIAGGGSGGYSWDLIDGGFPGGLTFNKDGGVVAGTPTQAGNYSVIIQATDIVSGDKTSKLFTFAVTDPGTITTTALSFVDQQSVALANNTLSLGTALKSTTVSKQFNLLNGGVPGSAAISISSVTFSDPAFSAILPIGSSIQPGAANAIPVKVTFVPPAANDYSATMTIKDSTGASSILNLLGSGSTVAVTLETGSTGSVTSFSSLTPAQLPISSKPETFSVTTAAQLRIDGASAGGTVNVNAMFETLPSNPVFYNVNGNTWTLITPTPTVSGSTVTLAVADNSALDFDPTSGTIVNTIVVGTTGTNSGTSGNLVGDGSVAASSTGGGGGGCFIATAAFGSYLDPHVMVLRHFRDDVLLQSELGTAFVTFYYKHSPPIAYFIAQHEILRMIFRLLLTPVILLVKLSWVSPVAMFLALGIWLHRSYRNNALNTGLNINSVE